MKLKDAVGLLATQGVVCRYSDDGGCDLVTHHGHLTNEEINYLCDAGFVYSMNGTYRLTDEGRLAYLRSTDELQDGVLRPPEATLRAWPGELETGQ